MRLRWGLCLALFLCAASVNQAKADPPPKRPNILLIVLDTLRFDALSPANTPFLDSLAKGGVAFTDARATHDFTPPSHFSIMTGFRNGLGTDIDRRKHGIAWQLSRNGYWTFATVANGMIGQKQMPVLRGFDDFKQVGDVNGLSALDAMGSMMAIDQRLAIYHVRPTTHARAMLFYTADRLLPLFLDQMRAAKRRPYFGFVNLVDPHEPYVPDPESYPPERALPRGFDGDVLSRRLGPELANPASIADPVRRAEVQAKIKAVRFPRLVSLDLSPEALAVYHSRYNAKVHELDGVLREFFEAAEKEHLLDDTVVIITSDHGESFGEEGYITHMLNDSGDDESTHHVPLIIVLPERFSRREPLFERRVSIASLAPTILDFAGVDWSAYRKAFRDYPPSLVPLITSAPPRVGRAELPPPEKRDLSHEAEEREKAMRSLGYLQ
jgi:arylsulfatase A-like enzyme